MRRTRRIPSRIRRLQAASSTPLRKESYVQNYQQFRALNQIMWQIPVLAMTLTGGLWFGVSRVSENFWFAALLLSTAIFGNIALAIVLRRFRYVMGCYLEWLEEAYPPGFVAANGEGNENKPWTRYCTSTERVRQMFSWMLYWVAGMSVLYLGALIMSETNLLPVSKASISEKYYDQHAEALADGYESVSFEEAYPFLVPLLSGDPLDVLDIGAGTGRDAAWMSSKGHRVIAVEPSSAMRKIARNLHSQTKITWLDASLPELDDSKLKRGKFEVVLVNAVWMHVRPTERKEAMARLYELTKVDGRVFVSLRIGPSDEQRGMYQISSEAFLRVAKNTGFLVKERGKHADVLGRADVIWEMYELQKQ